MAKKEKNNVITIPFRLAFPEVFEARAGAPGAKEKFSVTMLFPKDGSSLVPNATGSDLLALRKLAVAAIKEKWGNDKAKWPSNLKALDLKTALSPSGRDGWPFRDGDNVTWTGFEGMVSVKAGSMFQPGIVDAKKKEILTESGIWGGLICRADVNCWAYDTQGNQGVSFGLENLQVLKDDGVSFSGRSNASEAFDAFDDGSSEEGTTEDANDDFA